MRTHTNLWQMKQSVCGNVLPEESKVVDVSLIQQNNNVANKIDTNRYSKYKKLIEVTAKVIQVFHHIPKPSLRNIFEFPSVNSFKEAELFWVKDVQQFLLERIEKGDYVRLCPKKTNEGIYVVCGRAEDWFKNTYNSEGLIFFAI